MNTAATEPRFSSAKSDDLPDLIQMAQRMGLPSALSLTVPPYHAVLDANHVIAAIRYKVKSKREAPPRAHFEELVAARALVVYAPKQLAATVVRKLAVIAEDQNLPLDRMMWFWDEMKPSIHFVEPSGVDSPMWTRLRERDAEDVPYCQLVEDLGADFLLTGDKDFADAPVTVVSPQKARIALLALKFYVRARARELQSKTGVAGTAVLGLHLGLGVSRTVMRAPWWVQLGVLAASVLLLLNPRVRSRLGDTLRTIGSGVGTTFGRILTEGVLAEKEAGEKLELALKELSRREPTLLQAATRLMVRGGQGKKLSELESALRSEGHLKEPQGRARWLLRRALASSALFSQEPVDRTWWFAR